MADEQYPGYKDERYGQYRELLYSYDKDGNFKKDVGFHGEPDRVILQQAWDLFNDRIEDARRKVMEGKASPIMYYMEKNLLNPLDLSMHSGISLWRVKFHLKPKFFAKLSEKTLKKYAEAFNIPVEQLKKVE
jgi:hypothetical protein